MANDCKYCRQCPYGTQLPVKPLTIRREYLIKSIKEIKAARMIAKSLPKAMQDPAISAHVDHLARDLQVFKRELNEMLPLRERVLVLLRQRNVILSDDSAADRAAQLLHDMCEIIKDPIAEEMVLLYDQMRSQQSTTGSEVAALELSLVNLIK